MNAKKSSLLILLVGAVVLFILPKVWAWWFHPVAKPYVIWKPDDIWTTTTVNTTDTTDHRSDRKYKWVGSKYVRLNDDKVVGEVIGVGSAWTECCLIPPCHEMFGSTESAKKWIKEACQ